MHEILLRRVTTAKHIYNPNWVFLMYAYESPRIRRHRGAFTLEAEKDQERVFLSRLLSLPMECGLQVAPANESPIGDGVDEDGNAANCDASCQEGADDAIE